MEIDIDIQASKWDRKTKTREAIIDINAKRLGNKSLGYSAPDGAFTLPAITLNSPDDNLDYSQEFTHQGISSPKVETETDQTREDGKTPKPLPPAPHPAPIILPKMEDDNFKQRGDEASSRIHEKRKDDTEKDKPKKKLMMNWFALVWILAFLLTAALAIAALAVDEWADLKSNPTNTELSFGLWYTHEARVPSCNASDVAEVTIEAEYSEFRLNLVIAFMIVGIILDGVSLILGIFVLLARVKGRDRHWAWSIPTVVAVLLAGDFILAACAVFIWDLDHVPDRTKSIENSNCTTFLLYVYMTAHAQTSVFLAIASACFCLLKALIFGLVAHKIRMIQSKPE